MPSAAEGEAATVPPAAVSETTAGGAVEAAVAAILARSVRPKPLPERGGEVIPGQAARTSEPQAAAITAKVDETRPVNPTVNRPKHDQSLGRKRGIQRPISGAFVNRKEYR